MFFSIDKWKKEFLVMHAKINDAEIKNSILCLACESTNVNMLLNAILVPIIRLLEFDGAGFYQIDHKARQAKLVAYSGFDENFIRMWDFYLCYCEGGFKEGVISDVHMLFEVSAY